LLRICVVSWVVPGFSEERELGSGGSGRVVAAARVASGERVAIKYLSPHQRNISRDDAIGVLNSYGNHLIEHPGSSGPMTFDGWTCTHANVPEAHATGVWAVCKQGGITVQSNAS
jgi:hypothetical protein